jgi:hypothetical protein
VYTIFDNCSNQSIVKRHGLVASGIDNVASVGSRRSLSAIQHIRRLDGGTQPHLLRGSDGKLYLTKFKNNSRHIRVLANEFFGTLLGTWLGLPMPQAEVIEVSDWVIGHSPGLCIQNGETVTPCSAGLQFASAYMADHEREFPLAFVPPGLFDIVVNRTDLARVLVFDKWTGNCDARQAIFLKQGPHGPYKMTFVDQSECFNGRHWTFPDLPMTGTYDRDYHYADVTGWKSFEPVLSGIEALDYHDLWKLAVQIPPEWYEYDFEGLCKLIETLYRRRAMVRNLISRFRSFAPGAFPNWWTGRIAPVRGCVCRNSTRIR